MKVLTLVLSTAVLLSSCSTAPPTGIRKEFHDHQIQTIAVVPFYSRANFSIDPAELDKLRHVYEAAATSALRAEGFEVIDPRAFRQHLDNHELLAPFTEGIRLHGSLRHYFESSEHAPIPFEVQTLRTLSASPFPFNTLLFGEIVYQTAGMCRISATTANSFATTRTLPGAPLSFPRHCVVSHFQAKLVDVQSGETIWFNHSLLETYARSIEEEVIDNNISSVVNATFRTPRKSPAALRPRL